MPPSTTRGPEIYGPFDLVLFQRVVAFGGSERHSVDLIRYLVCQGWRVALVESGEPLLAERLQDLRDRMHLVATELPMRELSRSQVEAWRDVMRALPARRAVVVKPWFFVADLELLRVVRNGYPVVFHLEHSTLPKRARWSLRLHFDGRPRIGAWWFRETIQRRKMQKTNDRVIAVSDAMRRSLIEDGLVDPERIMTRPNGVDSEAWRRDELAGREFREQHGIPENAFLFGCVGRLAPEKGLELAIDAFDAVRRAAGTPEVFLCLVGDGPSRMELEEKGKRNSRYICFTGRLENVIPAYSAIDTLLLTTHHEQYCSGESFGLVLAEAMACECDVIAAGFGGVPEVVSDPSCGTLLATRDVSVWAAAMREHVARSPDERRARGRVARAFVQKAHEQRDRLAAVADALQAVHPRGTYT